MENPPHSYVIRIPYGEGMRCDGCIGEKSPEKNIALMDANLTRIDGESLGSKTKAGRCEDLCSHKSGIHT